MSDAPLEIWSLETIHAHGQTRTRYFIVNDSSQLEEWVRENVPPLRQRNLRFLTDNRVSERVFDLRDRL